MKGFWVFGFLGALITLFSVSIKAETKIGMCENCTTDWSYNQRARVVANEYTDYVYVLSFQAQQIKKFHVHSIPAEPGMPAQIVVYEEAVNAALSSAFIEHAQSRKILSGLLTDTVFPEDLATSAYQLVGREFLINDFLERFSEQHHGYIDRVISSAVVMANHLGLLDLNLYVTITFSNGDKIRLRVKELKSVPLVGGAKFNFEVVSIVDVDLNPVKLDPSGYTSGERRFETGGVMALNEFLGAAARMGISISASHFGPRVRIVDCAGTSGTKCIEPVPSTMLH